MSNIYYTGKERQMPHFFAKDEKKPFKQLLIFSETEGKKQIFNHIPLKKYKDYLINEEECFIDKYPLFKNVFCGSGYVFLLD